MNYLVVIENAGANYYAYVPDLPGCVATTATPHEASETIHSAIEMHLAGLRKDGERVPEPPTTPESATRLK